MSHAYNIFKESKNTFEYLLLLTCPPPSGSNGSDMMYLLYSCVAGSVSCIYHEYRDHIKCGENEVCGVCVECTQ